MALDEARFESLLEQAQRHASAASEGDHASYRHAFEATFEALRMLMDERDAWRDMVARATEEFQGDEGI